MTGRTWAALWRELAALPEFYRERRAAPQELALAVALPLLSVVLVTTLVAGVAAFLTALDPPLDLTGLVPLAVATAAAGYTYAGRLRWSGIIWREWVVLLAPFVLLWRLVTLLTLGPPLAATLRAWLADPRTIFDGPFVLGAALLLLAWTQGVGYGRDLAALHPPDLAPAPRPSPGDPAYWTADELRRASYAPAPASLVTRWLQGGLMLAVLGALGATGIRQTLNGPALLRLVTLAAPDESAALPNVLLYMLCGLVLVGLAQLSRLRANWIVDGVAVMPGLARRALLALAALVVAGLGIAFLLPTRYALGLSDLLAGLVDVVTFLVTLVYALVALLLWPLAMLFGHGGRAPRLPAAPRAAPPAAHAGHGGGDALGSLFFWVVALALIGYCAYTLLRNARGRAPGLGAAGSVVARVRAFIGRVARALLRLARRSAAGVARVAQGLTGATRARAADPRMRHTPLRRLGPRERVAYLYLSVEERARRLGLPRPTGETASEYSRRLRREMPDLDPDLDGLTDLFLEARYSPHPFDDERASSARPLWQRVRARLRMRRR